LISDEDTSPCGNWQLATDNWQLATGNWQLAYCVRCGGVSTTDTSQVVRLVMLPVPWLVYCTYQKPGLGLLG